MDFICFPRQKKHRQRQSVASAGGISAAADLVLVAAHSTPKFRSERQGWNAARAPALVGRGRASVGGRERLGGDAVAEGKMPPVVGVSSGN